MNRLLIAGPRSGVGKTTITLGLLAGLRERGLNVHPYKVGPDFIDLSFHAALTRRPCYNLDGWLMPGEQLVETFVRAAAGRKAVEGAGDAAAATARSGAAVDPDDPGPHDEHEALAPRDDWAPPPRRRSRKPSGGTPPADIAVVEGMMGLFDGVGSGDSGGSSADVARRLGLPVILVLDVRAMAGSAGAAALGYRDYDTEVDFSGVILNNVAGEHHARACSAALERTGIPIYGAVPINDKLRLPDRHLGLVPAWERSGPAHNVEEMALEVASHLDLDAIVDVAASAVPPDLKVDASPAAAPSQIARTLGRTVRIGVARDEAFGFYYQDTLDMLVAAGAELVIFRPTRDEALPPNVGGLYLGGGFPERHLDELEANVSLRDEIRARAEDGMPIIAECGGLMYLCRSISIGGFPKAMVGLLEGDAKMGARQAVAYVDIEVERDTPLAPRGSKLRGHVFHNSLIDNVAEDATFAYRLEPGPGVLERHDGWLYKNVLASYAHLPLAARPDLVERWVEACRAYKATTPPQKTYG